MNNKGIEEEHLNHLRRKVEEIIGRKVRQNADFTFLQQCIVEQTGERISTTTLKRLWGYVKDGGSPRTSILDLMARFVGSENWEAFTTAESERQAEPALAADPVTVTPQPKENFWHRHRIYIFLNFGILLLFAAYVAYTTFMRPNPVTPVNTAPQTSGKYTLTLGQKFSSYDEYLRLFGVTAKDTLWSQPVPHHKDMILWGPQYNHPEWHNTGNPDSLMPTITEYWEPADTKMTPELRKVLQHMNTIGYQIARRNNEIRITFMRDLVDSNFVFLGVYRVSLTKSDTTRIVWERVAEECDLDRLGYLELFRN